MKNNYLPQTKDLDVSLEGNEIEKLGQRPLEGDLTQGEKPLGKKLILKKQDFALGGDGIEVEYIRSRHGGWEAVTALEVMLNNNAYSHLKKHNKVGSRHGGGAWIEIYGPGEIRF
ncbi:MAG: hypothetical protein NTY20_06035 [Candidatus Aenigmarchaeota archaeon]|nr:hypothetical protein [Candidatus Aenigmarchaeota archaeon]